MKKISFFVIFLLFLQSSAAQTSGIGEVVSIEKKASDYSKNLLEIQKIRSELPVLEADLNAQVKKLEDEISELYKEMENIIKDMKVGAKCSQCGDWKSEFEKRGEDFEKHLGEVKGYAIPATTDQLEATRKYYREKIAIKKVQVMNLKKNSLLVKKQEQLRKLETANETICLEIKGHSDTYSRLSVEEGKRLHSAWANQLLGIITKILIADDQITIHEAKIARLEDLFEKKKIELRQKLETESEVLKRNQEENVVQIEKHIESIIGDQKTFSKQMDERTNELLLKISNISAQISELATDSLSTTLIEERDKLQVELNTLNKDLADYNSNVELKISGLKDQIKIAKDEIWNITSGLTEKQDKAVLSLKEEFDQLIAQGSGLVNKYNFELSDNRNNYNSKVNELNKKQQDFLSLIDGEIGRIGSASRVVNCAVRMDAKSSVVLNWNKVFPCVDAITKKAKPYSTHVFNSYCTEDTSGKEMASYKSFLLSLTAEDKEAVLGNSNKWWFEEVSN